jgi:hypothetical protein
MILRLPVTNPPNTIHDQIRNAPDKIRDWIRNAPDTIRDRAGL